MPYAVAVVYTIGVVVLVAELLRRWECDKERMVRALDELNEARTDLADVRRQLRLDRYLLTQLAKDSLLGDSSWKDWADFLQCKVWALEKQIRHRDKNGRFVKE